MDFLLNKIISTHALTWSATVTEEEIIAAFIISTHALTWSATQEQNMIKLVNPFQLTHSRGVRLWRTCPASPILAFQLTQSRGVRRCGGWCVGSRHISTHALTWSATSEILMRIPTNTISTHALTWSATLGKPATPNATEISTHALTWSATTTKTGNKTVLLISTHALTWSATTLL